jgi:hypothetical protein
VSATVEVPSVTGGKGDLAAVISLGLVMSLTPKENRCWDFFDLPLGALTAGGDEWGWLLAALAPAQLRTSMGSDTMESYPLGTFTTPDGGADWAAPGITNQF